MQSEGKKVLIVEDEPREAQALAIALNRLGFSIQIANSGEVGLKKLVKSRFDFVLCDINMPNMDGFELFNRAKPFTSADFIFMTADPQFIMKDGLSNCVLLIKPIELNSIIELINRKCKESITGAFC